MKKILVTCLAVLLMMAGTNALTTLKVHAVEAGPGGDLDFTTMAVATAIPKENFGAVDASTNYQIGLQDSANTLYTVNGYNATWITWKLEAPAGKQFTDADLQIVGKICDYAENENLFGVFVYDEQPDGSNLGGSGAEAVHFENAAEGTMPNSGSYLDVHDFDLSGKIAGKTVAYVTVYQMTTGSPEWIGYRTLSLTSVVEDIPAPALVVSGDGLSIAIDFTLMPVATAIPKEDFGAVDASTNYQIGLQDSANTLYTVNGYNATWITWKLEAPAGKQFTDADLQIVGKICDYAENENLFGVFVYDEQPDGSNLGGSGAEAVHFENAAEGTMPNSGSYVDVHDFDLSGKIAGKTVAYVTVYQMTTGSPEWIGYRSLSLTAEVEDLVGDNPDPTEEPDPTDTPVNSDDESPLTGSALPMLPMLLSAGLISVTMVKSRRK